MKAAIFTGSRNLKNEHHSLILNRLNCYKKEDIIIHGNCSTGADYMVDILAKKLGFTIIRMPAQWDKYGNKAGPLRNKEMLNLLFCLKNCGYEIFIEAFPLKESKGTYNMIKIARQAGLEVNPHYFD